jgi:hypothetical protein
MDTTCTKNALALESKQDAEKPFGEKSILLEKLDRDRNGLITQNQFDALLDVAKKDGRYILGNQHSFYMLASSTQREYCYSLQRYAYYLKDYQTSVHLGSPNKTSQQKYIYFRARLEDLLSVLEFMERVQLEGEDANLVSPSASQDSYSSQAFPIETFQDSSIDITGLRARMNDLDYENEVKLRQDRLEYSVEKNRYAKNSLALYTFLNLTAVGILLYLFRK